MPFRSLYRRYVFLTLTTVPRENLPAKGCTELLIYHRWHYNQRRYLWPTCQAHKRVPLMAIRIWQLSILRKHLFHIIYGQSQARVLIIIARIYHTPHTDTETFDARQSALILVSFTAFSVALSAAAGRSNHVTWLVEHRWDRHACNLRSSCMLILQGVSRCCVAHATLRRFHGRRYVCAKRQSVFLYVLFACNVSRLYDIYFAGDFLL